MWGSQGRFSSVGVFLISRYVFLPGVVSIGLFQLGVIGDPPFVSAIYIFIGHARRGLLKRPSLPKISVMRHFIQTKLGTRNLIRKAKPYSSCKADKNRSDTETIGIAEYLMEVRGLARKRLGLTLQQTFQGSAIEY
jgi:hypothetical protein